MKADSSAADAKKKRAHYRKVFCKTGLIILDGQPQMMIETINISASGVGIICPVHPIMNSTCWIRLRIPQSHENNQIFDVKATVVNSIFSRDKSGFKVGLSFLNPPPQMVKLINQIK
jgi:hypothetical protein